MDPRTLRFDKCNIRNEKEFFACNLIRKKCFTLTVCLFKPVSNFIYIYKILNTNFLQDYNDDIRQEQMWEMQVLSSQKNNNKGGDEASGGSSSGAEYAGEDRLSTETTEPGPESPQDEHPALRGIQSGKFANEKGVFLIMNGFFFSNTRIIGLIC